MNKKKQILEELRKKLQSNKDNGEPKGENNTKTNEEKGKALTIGTLPGVPREFFPEKNNPYHGEKGFSSALMLGFLVFLFEIIFLIISYFIFK